jgi:hypothetical protein
VVCYSSRTLAFNIDLAVITSFSSFPAHRGRALPSYMNVIGFGPRM